MIADRQRWLDGLPRGNPAPSRPWYATVSFWLAFVIPQALVGGALGLTTWGAQVRHLWWVWALLIGGALAVSLLVNFTGWGRRLRGSPLFWLALILLPAYALALQWLPWRYDLLLAIVLLAVAAGTYVLGKLWAFRSATHRH